MGVRALLTFALLACVATLVAAKYEQVVSDRYTWKGAARTAAWKVLDATDAQQIVLVAFDGGSDVWVLSTNGLWAWSGAGLLPVNVNGVTAWPAGSRVISLNSQSTIAVLATPTGIMWLSCDSVTSCKVVGSTAATWGLVVSVAFDQRSSMVWIATSKGLWVTSAKPSSAVVQETRVDHGCTSMEFSHHANSLAVGTDWKLWVFNLTDTTWRYEWAWGIMDNNITSVTWSQDDTLWVGNSDALNWRVKSGEFFRMSGLTGLPTGNISFLQAMPASGGPSDGLWLTSVDSVALYQPQRALSTYGPWRYFNGLRWLPAGPVTALLVWADRKQTLVATKGGLAIFRWESYTLGQKAALYEDMVRPRHDRHGLCSEVRLRVPGDVSSWDPNHQSDNDGLWTSLYLASQALRWAVTKDPSAKANAWHALDAMELLHNITGIKGLFARSVLGPGEKLDPGGHWYNSSTMPGWMWKGDTSSDEMAGHGMAFPLMYALVAETPAEKSRVLSLHTVTLDYIMANNWTLIDITGKRTEWGFWDPTDLNEVPQYYDQRGLNALQILQMLASASVLSGDPKYLAAINDLGVKYGYFINIINQKITTPNDDNFSDDELAYVPYLAYFLDAKSHATLPYHPYFIKSLQRTWDAVKPGHSSLWGLISALGLPAGTVDLTGPLQNLERWPIEMIDWNFKNSDRIDHQVDPALDRENKPHSARVFSPDESTTLRWNADPYTIDGGDGGNSEIDPSAYLLPYWLGRYMKVINE